MVQLKLVGGEYYFDNFGNEGFSLTRKLIDFQKPDNTYNDFSQKVNLPATQRNNKLFQFYYNIAVQDGFNPFVKNECELWFNSELYSTGALLLLDVKWKDGEVFMYTVQFFSDTINLKEALKDKGLNDIEWQDLDHSSTVPNVANYLSGAAVAGGKIYYPMASMQNAWVWDLAGNVEIEGIRRIASNKDGILNTEVRPAILVSEVVKRIFDTAGFDYEIDFNTESYWTELFMWINNGRVLKGISQNDEILVEAGIGAATQVKIPRDAQKIIFSREVSDSSSLYSTITGETTIALDGNYSVTTYFSIIGATGTKQVRLVINGAVTSWVNITNNTEQVIWSGAAVAGDTIYIQIQGSGLAFVRDANLASTSYFKLEGVVTTALDRIEVGKFMPKMKCIDFLKGILVATNSVVYFDNITSKFIIKHRDQWIAEGNEVDLSQFIDAQSLVVQPPTFYKTYGFEFEEGKDFANVNYQERNGRRFGAAFYDTGMYFGNEYVGSIPFTSNIWAPIVTQDDQGGIIASSGIPGAFSVDKSFKPVESGVRLMYRNGTDSIQGNYKIVNADNSDAAINSTYNRFLNVLESDGVSISFQPQRTYDGTGVDQGSFYNSFYRDYIAGIYNPNVRRLTLEALMPYAKLKTIQLNDTIIWNDKPYLIDQMTINMVSGRVKFNLINKL